MLSQKSIPGNHLVVYVDNDFDDDDDGDTYDFAVVVIIIGMMMMLMIIMVTMFDLESVGAYTHFNWRSCRQFARRKNARNVRRAHFQMKMRALAPITYAIRAQCSDLMFMKIVLKLEKLL